MADLALEAAAEEAVRFFEQDEVWAAPLEPAEWVPILRPVIAAYLDSLLGGLPEEAVRAGASALSPLSRQPPHIDAKVAIEAAVRSLRSGLERDGDK